jgi:hypothetical protein
MSVDVVSAVTIALGAAEAADTGAEPLRLALSACASSSAGQSRPFITSRTLAVIRKKYARDVIVDIRFRESKTNATRGGVCRVAPAGQRWVNRRAKCSANSIP